MERQPRLPLDIGLLMEAQGKRVSAPPWGEETSELFFLPRVEVLKFGETCSQSGGEGKGSGGVM
jgi:hypothetical protein